MAVAAASGGQVAHAEPQRYADPTTAATAIIGIKDSKTFKSACAEGAVLGAAAAAGGFTIGAVIAEPSDAVSVDSLYADQDEK